MGLLAFIRKNRPAAAACGGKHRGILVFENTSEVIRSETLLKAAGFAVRVMGPPPEIRTGCDLVIEFPLVSELEITRTLESEAIFPLQVAAVSDGLLEPVSIFFTKDYGSYLMVQAANMKITVEKKSLRVVNISGGGCPDVPYLAAQMVGLCLDQTPQPRSIGHTLCGYALQLAWEEVKRQCSR
ncbi:MAG TPA: DUF3343 domain-containing protein [Desulfosalsimonadaceae bacterium]|nr:DUF3343 domain-containing protein [Desulfosalsimonadaceae bacterium]